eukprot:6101286-Pleurochrysis_carterae.AAC.1
MRFLPGGEYVVDYAARAEDYYSTPPDIFYSSRVLWIEIWRDDHRGVIPVRLLGKSDESAPEASLLGVRLTEDTYRRLMSNNCSTALPATLPEEFRWRNSIALEWLARRRTAEDGEGSSGIPLGSATLSAAQLSETRQTETSGEAGGT